MLKVAVLGMGSISKTHMAVWQKMNDVKIVGVCDVVPSQMDEYTELCKYTSFEDMVAAEKPDILDICLPTYLHSEYSIKAIGMGINVICEKPISMNKEDVKRIFDAAEKNNVKFMVAQVLRFWPEYEFVKEAFETERYGKLLCATMSRIGNMPKDKWQGWMSDEKRSGLVPYDLHVHDLDFLVYAFGKPQNVQCTRIKKNEDYDYVSVRYDFDGFFVNTEAAWDCAPHPFSASFRFQFENAVLINSGDKLLICER